MGSCDYRTRFGWFCRCVLLAEGLNDELPAVLEACTGEAHVEGCVLQRKEELAVCTSSRCSSPHSAHGTRSGERASRVRADARQSSNPVDSRYAGLHEVTSCCPSAVGSAGRISVWMKSAPLKSSTWSVATASVSAKRSPMFS